MILQNLNLYKTLKKKKYFFSTKKIASESEVEFSLLEGAKLADSLSGR